MREADIAAQRKKHDEDNHTYGYWADTMVMRKCLLDMMTIPTVGEA